MYNITKKLAGNPKVADRPEKDKNGTVLKNQLKRWVEHFRELLNRPPPMEPAKIDSTETPTRRGYKQLG